MPLQRTAAAGGKKQWSHYAAVYYVTCCMPHGTHCAVIMLHNSYFTPRVAAIVSAFCSVNWRHSAVPLCHSAANTSGKLASELLM